MPDEDAAEPIIPTYDALMWPVLQALQSLGGEGTTATVLDRVAIDRGFSETQKAQLLPSGRRSVLRDRVGWALSYLKLGGVLFQPRRGVYALAESAAALTPADIPGLNALVRSRRTLIGKDLAETVAPADGGSDGDGSSDSALIDATNGTHIDWRDRLLSILRDMSPASFESLCKLVLIQTGLTDVRVTGGTGDRGIDGVGVLRIGLLSFKVVYQSKRYSGTVGVDAVRNLQAAASGRAERGLLFTTGEFSRDARQEASRDGAIPIELIDGQRLCDLLKQHSIGLRTRQVEEVDLDPLFFESV